jgi:hypothetical protein
MWGVPFVLPPYMGIFTDPGHAIPYMGGEIETTPYMGLPANMVLNSKFLAVYHMATP